MDNKDLEFIELANEVDQLKFLTQTLLHDLQELISQAPAPVQQYFQAKRVIYKTNVITYDIARRCYLLNGIPLSKNIITQALERDNPELIPDVHALAPVFPVR